MEDRRSRLTFNLILMIVAVFFSLPAGITLAYTVAPALLHHYGPKLEPILNPVISKFTITKMVVVDESSTYVWARARKHRECLNGGTEWFALEEDGSLSDVQFNLRPFGKREMGQTKPVGILNMGSWLIHLPMDEVKKRSVVFQTYNCHNKWPTVMVVYP